MKIKDLFTRKTVFSFEVFPPKKTSPVETIFSTLEELRDLKPDFISVTLGAGGSGNGGLSCDIASKIKDEYGITPMLHLPCVNHTQEQITCILTELESRGIENVLALRGDITPGIEPVNHFRYASDLVSFIKKHGDFDVAGACYPECHGEQDSLAADILNLKKKVDAGADHLITQLFFDNSVFYDFIEKVRIAGINVPVEAGIMPVVNKNQIERMVAMCGASLPNKFVKVMQRYEGNPAALRDAGIAFAIDQIIDLVAQGVDGIHLYTMNNPYVARKISEAVNEIFVG